MPGSSNLVLLLQRCVATKDSLNEYSPFPGIFKLVFFLETYSDVFLFVSCIPILNYIKQKLLVWVDLLGIVYIAQKSQGYLPYYVYIKYPITQLPFWMIAKMKMLK
jgi:hypothetical protein